MKDRKTKSQPVRRRSISAGDGDHPSRQNGTRFSAVLREVVFYVIVLVVLFVFGLIITVTLRETEWWR